MRKIARNIGQGLSRWGRRNISGSNQPSYVQDAWAANQDLIEPEKELDNITQNIKNNPSVPPEDKQPIQQATQQVKSAKLAINQLTAKHSERLRAKGIEPFNNHGY